METQEKEFFARNSELSMEFSKYVLEHPEMDDLLTEEAVVVFLPEFDAEPADFNSRMAKEIEDEGGRVLYVKVKQMAPKISSRLMGVEVGVARPQLEY
ncbi:MAG: DUF5647 family protein [Candidatus Methanoperedens sp.]